MAAAPVIASQRERACVARMAGGKSPPLYNTFWLSYVEAMTLAIRSATPEGQPPIRCKRLDCRMTRSLEPGCWANCCGLDACAAREIGGDLHFSIAVMFRPSSRQFLLRRWVPLLSKLSQ